MRFRGFSCIGAGGVFVVFCRWTPFIAGVMRFLLKYVRRLCAGEGYFMKGPDGVCEAVFSGWRLFGRPLSADGLRFFIYN